MTPSRVDTYPVFDRALGLTNGTAGAGGMLTYVATGDVVTFTTQPVSQTVRVGTPVSFSAAITGTGPFGYQWRKDSQDIPGATDLTYNIAAAALTDAGSYTLVVTSTLGSFSSATAVLTVADLQLTSPNGGESWPLGSTQTVTWNGPGIGPSIKLKLWRNGVFTGYFLTGIEDNDGSYTWKIPGTLTEGAGYRIQVYTPDYSFSDFSDADFDLAPNPLGPNPLVLTSPNGGETWPLASTQTITWNGPNAGPSIKLRLWHNGTFTGYYLTGIEDNDGSYTWKIPGTLTADSGYRIQVYTPDYTYSDFSDADFTLTPDPLGPNPLTLTSPNGGESWAVGGIQTITWNGPGVGPYVKLRLWRNGVFTGYYLTGNEANDGSYTWYIPSTLAPDTTYKIQVYTPDYTYSDFSDAPFTVTANPLRLIRPNGGEAWALGSTQSVDWESGPAAGPNVKLKLWLNGVFTGYYLTGIEPNDGGYTWKIPSTLAPVSGYMIQVYTPDYSFSDFSDSAFSLVP